MIPMKPKKKVGEWHIAITFYLTSGFAIPFVVYIVCFVVLGTLAALFNVDLKNMSNLVASVIWVVFTVGAVSFGIIYGARYVNNRYVIVNKESVIQKTMIVVVGLMVMLGIVPLFLEEKSLEDIIFTMIRVAIVIALFYVLSQKFLMQADEYIQNDGNFDDRPPLTKFPGSEV